MSQPLVSIITPSYNQGSFIEQTIQSVLSQTYPHIEYIVLDACSTDSTPVILNRYRSQITRVICEEDGGQANAINRGFAIANGEIVSWLNADDVLMPDAVERVVAHFRQHCKSAFVYGDAIAMDHRGNLFGRRVNVAPCTHKSLVEVGDFIVQPAAFWRRQVMESVGVLDESLNYTLDYEYWMRIAQQYSLDYMPVPLAYERLYGGTKTSEGGLQRILELRVVAELFQGEDIPLLFRPEAAATFLREALRVATLGRYKEARELVAEALYINNHAVKFFLHFFVGLLWGGGGTMRLRLWSNLIRNYVRLPRFVRWTARRPAPVQVRVSEPLA